MFITAAPANSRESLANAFRQVIAEHIRVHALGTNVDRSTLLASDYLNHFNEVVMMLDALPDAPGEFADSIKAWKPISYVDYFQSSPYRDRALAIVAYRNAPDSVRAMFDASVAALHHETDAVVKQVRSLLKKRNPKTLEKVCRDAVPRLTALIAQAQAIVNGETKVLAFSPSNPMRPLQERVDILFAA